ncbi:MAG: Gfo/Idh/MocA family oxidoreductase [Candidatus Bathyarchaeota archaeon]|nr:Gfo/Idh/MocA family oxidoreductase [Candidatus Bathyarchaeota archaeon]
MSVKKLGIIGIGGIGQLHLKHALALEHAQVVAVADTSKPALKRAKDMGVKVTYSDYMELLKNPQLDAVIIALPTHLHLKCARDAAEAKKHVFLEKPIAVTVEDAKEVISCTERNGVKLMLGYPMRFNQHFLKLKADMEEGLIGDVENAHATYICAGPFVTHADGHGPVPVPEWWFNPLSTGGGVMVDLGCHIINLMRMLFGEIVDIQGQFGYRYRMDFEDSAMCLARFESGTLAVINVGWYSQEYTLRLDLLGSVRNVSVAHMPPKSVPAMYQMLTRGISSFNMPHFDELQYFVNCLRSDTAPSPTGLDGLRDIEAIVKAYKNRINL